MTAPPAVAMNRAGQSEVSSEPQTPSQASLRSARRGRLKMLVLLWNWTTVRHAGLSTVVLTALVIIGISAATGNALLDWAVALGMDEERGALIASLLAVSGGTAAATLLSPRPGAARLGAVIAMVVIEVVPFVEHARSVGTTPGLIARLDVIGWVLQPLGMLLLGLLAACVGAGVGLLLRRDAERACATLRAHRLAWGGVVVAAGTVVAASGAAVTALQTGPISALYTYGTYGVVPASTPAAVAPGLTPLSTPLPEPPFTPGHLEEMQVAGRRVIVDVPGGYATQPRRSFPVLYLLHGYPASPDAAIAGLQVGGVIDQLVASHRLPPTIIVVPDGNGRVSSDAEWGNNPNGNRVETWLVTQAIPAVDARYRTLGATFRGIAGYSSGGFGAVNLAMRHPALFRWAASWSGYFEGRRDIFVADAAANSPDRTARQLSRAQRMPVYLGAGERDAYFLDDTRKFDAELRSLGWAGARTEVVPGGHGVEAWRAQMVSSLTWLGSLWVASSCPEWRLPAVGCTVSPDG